MLLNAPLSFSNINVTCQNCEISGIRMLGIKHCLKLLKDLKDYDLSIDDSAMHPKFRSHFLSLDKDTEFSINFFVF